MNRLGRDALLIRALDMVDSPSLDAKDRPGGTIVATALSIGWLQDALDLFHNKFPWSGIIASASVALAASNPVAALPATFILDVRNGLTLPAPDRRRLIRWPLQKFINASLKSDTAATPERYVILPPDLRVWPTPKQAYSATLWFYSLPVVLSTGTVPNFPSDWVLIEYTRLRGLEWVSKIQPGTAMEYANKEIGALLRSGLGHEPEDSELLRDPDVYGPQSRAPWDWMGSPVVS